MIEAVDSLRDASYMLGRREAQLEEALRRMEDMNDLLLGYGPEIHNVDATSEYINSVREDMEEGGAE